MSALLSKLLDSLSVQQVCWSCLIVTLTACGYAVNTYASSSSVIAVRTEVAQMRIDFLEDRMFNLRVRQCSAIKEGKPSAAYREKLQDLLRQYYEQLHARYELSPCDEL